MKEISKSKEKLKWPTILSLTLMQLQCGSTISSSLGYSPSLNPVLRHGRNDYSWYREHFLVSSTSVKLKSIIKTTKKTNTRGHKFTSMTQMLHVRYQHCDNYYTQLVSIFIHSSHLYYERRWSIMIPQIQIYPPWAKYLLKHAKYHFKHFSTTH